MNIVTISRKFQVAIPKSVRGRLGIEAGQKFQVIGYDGRVELIPAKDMKTMRGFARGITSVFRREQDRI
jgi:AbrB family looped-hinge helix DNA binding protein